MDNSTDLTLRILTPLNYLDWRGDMHIVLHNNGIYRVTMCKEIEPKHDLKKSKYLNILDEAFHFVYSYLQGVSLPP